MHIMVRVRQDGSIGIPVHVRHRLGVVPGQMVTITKDAQNRSYLKPEQLVCSCCHQKVNAISTYTGLCPACEQLVELHVQNGMALKYAIIEARKTGRDTTV